MCGGSSQISCTSGGFLPDTNYGLRPCYVRAVWALGLVDTLAQRPNLHRMSTPTTPPTPADQLVGKRLGDRWTVIKRIARPESATGGHFSSSYIVESDSGRTAFLKAMDYRQALESPNPARALQAMTAAYNFERDVLNKCRDRRLTRIVSILDSGTLPASANDPSSVVEYLVFELASGDVRSFVDVGKAFETAWALRTIHQAAAALQQLHSAQIAHQDLKPSNVLVFEVQHSKIADLGSASERESVCPRDTLECAGGHYLCAAGTTLPAGIQRVGNSPVRL